MLKRILCGAVLLTLSVVNAGAQGVFIGPAAGYQQANDADNGNFMGGAALRAKFSPAFGGEASIYYRQEDFADGKVTLRNWPVMATALFYPFPFVYGAVGGGWFHTTFDYSKELNSSLGIKDETMSEFGWHFGGGVEFAFNTMVLTGDIRYVFLNYNFKNLPGRDIDSNFYMVTLGVLFNLSGISR